MPKTVQKARQSPNSNTMLPRRPGVLLEMDKNIPAKNSAMLTPIRGDSTLKPTETLVKSGQHALDKKVHCAYSSADESGTDDDLYFSAPTSPIVGGGNAFSEFNKQSVGAIDASSIPQGYQMQQPGKTLKAEASAAKADPFASVYQMARLNVLQNGELGGGMVSSSVCVCE